MINPFHPLRISLKNSITFQKCILIMSILKSHTVNMMKNKIQVVIVSLLMVLLLFSGSALAGGDNNQNTNGEDGNYEENNNNPYDPNDDFPGENEKQRSGVVW